MTEETITQEPTTEPKEPETMVVDFGSAKLTLPTDDAKAFIAERDKRQGEHREVLTRLEAIERDKAEAARKAQEAEDRAKAAELAKKGNLEEAEKVWKAQTEKEKATLIGQLKTQHLDLALAKRSDILDGTAGVVRDYIERRTKYDVESGTVVAVAEDGSQATNSEGSAITVDAYIDAFLADNPAFAKAKAPAHSGGNPQQPQGSGRIVSRAEFESWRPLRQSRFYAEGGKVRD